MCNSVTPDIPPFKVHCSLQEHRVFRHARKKKDTRCSRRLIFGILSSSALTPRILSGWGEGGGCTQACLWARHAIFSRVKSEKGGSVHSIISVVCYAKLFIAGKKSKLYHVKKKKHLHTIFYCKIVLIQSVKLSCP